MTKMEGVGDYDLRGPDFETRLIGPITATIIDADRMVRTGEDAWNNGFPNWAMYRCAFAGDTNLQSGLLDWCVAFAVAYSETGGIRKHSDDAAWCAGKDAYTALITTKFGAPSDELAEALGMAPKTYRKLRNSVYKRLRASLDEYWVRLQIGMRQAVLQERRAEHAKPVVRLASGRGFDQNDALMGDGNLRAIPRGSGC